MVEKIILYAAYLITIGLFILLLKRLRPAFKFKLTPKQQLALNPDNQFIEAVKISVLHGKVNSQLLQRRMKLKRDEAEKLLSALVVKGIIAPADKQGVSEVIA